MMNLIINCIDHAYSLISLRLLRFGMLFFFIMELTASLTPVIDRSMLK